MPGENAELSLSVLVDDTIASQLNMGATHLEETLVLHTALGRDHFVAVTGDYGTPSSALKGCRTSLSSQNAPASLRAFPGSFDCLGL